MTGIEKVLAKVAEAETVAAKATLIAARLTNHGKPCSRQIVEHWVREGRVPAKWAPAVNRLYRVPLHELNDSVYEKISA